MSLKYEDKFSPEMPTTTGLWEFICGENDGLPERCAIMSQRSQVLVHSEHLGVTPLRYFHDGLTQIQWRKIA